MIVPFGLPYRLLGQSSGIVNGRPQVRNQVNALMPHGEALILITKILGEDS